MAEEEEVSEDDLDALADAISGEGEGGEDLDPLAEEMLKMMEEEGDGADAGSPEDVDRMMEMEMLKAMEDDSGGGGALSGAATSGDEDESQEEFFDAPAGMEGGRGRMRERHNDAGWGSYDY